MSDPLHALKKGLVINDYEIIRVLGTGGFGITYLAYDDNLARPVAIKEYMPSDLAVRSEATTIAPKSDKDRDDFQWGLERFLDEARVLARFDHPNIVKVYRHFEAHGTAYIVMEYVEGETLSEMLRRKKILNYDELSNLLNPVLDGLSLVHKNSFLHRDIKPANIIMRSTTGEPVLIDFGAARMAIGAKSRSVTAIVTPGYAPIEQYAARGKQGAWTDLYALAAIAYKAIVGKTPIDATERVRRDPLVPLAQSKIPGKLGYPDHYLAAIDAALRVDEDDRPQAVMVWRDMLSGSVKPKPLANAPKHDDEKTVIMGADKGGAVDKKTGGNGLLFGLLGLTGVSAVAAGAFFMLRPDDVPVPDPTDPAPIIEANNNDTPAPVTMDTAADDAAYEKAVRDGRVSAYGWYATSFPKGVHFAAADKGAWNSAERQDSKAAYRAYLQYFEQGIYAGQARDKLTALAASTPTSRPSAGSGNYGRAVSAYENDDFQKAFSLFKALADNGDKRAQYYVAYMYQNGEGVASSDSSAAKWYRKSADQGYADAQYELGEMYFFGRGLPESNEDAAIWIPKAANQGHADAQERMGFMYEEGFGFDQSNVKAVLWYRKAAKQGEPLSMDHLGDMYEDGRGLPRSKTEVAGMFRELAEQGNEIGERLMGDIYRKGEGVTKSYANAAKWYRKAADQGDAAGQVQIGRLYEFGNGVTESKSTAVKWYRKAANQDNKYGQYELGTMYDNGAGIAQDYVQAVKWYTKAAEQGHPAAQNNLGFKYDAGQGVEQSDETALFWYRKSAAQNHGSGQFNLGMMYEAGQGIAQSRSEAISWYRKAVRNGNERAQEALERLGED